MKAVFFLGLLGLLLLAGCVSQTNQNQIADPASVYCEEQGGTLEIAEESGGQLGYCTLPNGTRCEEWAYYRGECGVPTACTEDAKLCPDGSYVGRVPPTCEFAGCPKPDCGFPCPLFTPPAGGWCNGGRIVESAPDECGCYRPPTCQTNYCIPDRNYDHNVLAPLECVCPEGYEFQAIEMGLGPCPPGISDCPEATRFRCVLKQ